MLGIIVVVILVGAGREDHEIAFRAARTNEGVDS
jgi:hypothetical protein